MEKCKELCRGCHSNIYNKDGRECREYKEAEVVQRIPIGVNQDPPFKTTSYTTIFDCYNDKQIMYVKDENLDGHGFWRN